MSLSRAVLFIALLAFLIGNAVGWGLAGNQPERYGPWAATFPALSQVLAPVGRRVTIVRRPARSDCPDLRQAGATSCVTLQTTVPGVTMHVLNPGDRPRDMDPRWWVNHPYDLNDLWVVAQLPADQWALAHDFARAGQAVRPELFDLDPAARRADTQYSAQQALAGHPGRGMESWHVIDPSENGLRATALFMDGLKLPLTRASKDAPWSITTQGPLNHLPALIAALPGSSS